MRVFVGLIVVAAFVAACGSSDKASGTPKNTNTPKPAATEKPPATAKPPAETATAPLPSNTTQIGNLLLTLNGVQPYTDDLFPAEAGTHYVAVDITAKNTGDKTYDLNVFNFHLKDSAKFANDPAVTQGPEPKIGATSMTAAQEIRGYIVFKLKDGNTPDELQYQSFTGSSGTIKVQ